MKPKRFRIKCHQWFPAEAFKAGQLLIWPKIAPRGLVDTQTVRITRVFIHRSEIEVVPV